MARFKYLGETPRPGMVSAMGDTVRIRIPLQDGTKMELAPLVGPKFIVGEDIGYDITDARAVRILEADTRYERIS